MTRWMTPLLAGSVCLAVGAGAAALAGGHAKFALDRLIAFEAPPPDQAPPPADRAPPRGRARDNAAAALAGAYDSLTLAAATARAGEGDNAKDQAHLLDAARDFYRTAHKAFKDGDYDRAGGTATAADAAASGVMLTAQADAAKAADVPAPPAPPAAPPPGGEQTPAPKEGRPPLPAERDSGDPAADLIRRTGDYLDQASKDDTKGPGAPFLDAARKTLDRAKQAQKDGDTFRAATLARAADAWSQVGNLLRQADQPPDRNRPRLPAAEDRKDRPPPEK